MLNPIKVKFSDIQVGSMNITPDTVSPAKSKSESSPPFGKA